MTKRRVNEIFYSLQGEGFHTGTPAVFIRFSGCNLHCPFCDTQHESGCEMTDREIFDEVCRYNAPLVILTGGEPAIHIDSDFVEKLKEITGAEIAIETNGTRPVPDAIDWITVSPKTGLSDRTKDLPVVIGRADEIKVVDLGQSLDTYFDLRCYTSDTIMYLQPCYVSDPVQALLNQKRTIDRVLADPRWRLSVQTHRLLHIR